MCYISELACVEMMCYITYKSWGGEGGDAIKHKVLYSMLYQGVIYMSPIARCYIARVRMMCYMTYKHLLYSRGCYRGGGGEGCYIK